MRRSVPLVAIVLSLVLAGSAMAAPTASQVTTPSDPSFPDFNEAVPSTLTVAGATSGGSGDVDLRCYTASDSKLIASGVAVAGGAFSTEVQMANLVAALGYPYPYCVLRAVPAGTTPADPSPFQGPHIGAGGDKPFTLDLNGGAANPPGTIWDYKIKRTQSAAFNNYYSAGGCGLCETFLLHPVTGAASHMIWWSNAGLYRTVPYAPANTRSAVRIDGIDAYNPAGAATNGVTFRDNPGFPPLSYQRSVAPASGDLTIEETNPFVTCAPQPATYPATDASCSSYATAGVRLVRTWTQRRGGLQLTLVDRWQSTDGQTHQLDAYYDQTAESENYSTAGRAGQWQFPWTADGFTSYTAQTTIARPPAVPATYFVKTDASTPASGDGSNPVGAVTLGSVPDELIVRRPSDTAHEVSDWQERYLRTIPAGGEVRIEYVYSHDYSLTSVQSMATDAEQALGGAGPAPAPATRARRRRPPRRPRPQRRPKPPCRLLGASCRNSAARRSAAPRHY